MVISFVANDLTVCKLCRDGELVTIHSIANSTHKKV
ncbi:MAG: hypothetical protein AWU57_4182 [Marinobacter sp. T13-3]|nr:MAG: hypothetical protein AWU57_4182 [Marinobacter sp. T13-3]